jgi:hypothetical protein
MNTLFCYLASIYLLASLSEAFTPKGDQSTRHASSQLYFTDDMIKSGTATRLALINGKKPTIAKINSLDDLKYFLQEDDRMVAIK